MLWALAQVCLISALELLKPWPLKLIIDSVLGGAPLPWELAAGLGTGAMLLGACAALVVIYAALGAANVLGQHHHRPHRAADGARPAQRPLRPPAPALDGLSQPAQAGDLLYRVTADTFALQTLTMNCLFPAASALILLVGMSAVMVQLDAELTLLALGVCPLLLLAIGRLNRRISAAAGEMRERESEVLGVVQRAMGAMRVIQAFTREEDEHRRFMTASERSLAAGLRLYTLQTFYSGVVNLVIALGTAAVVWMGARHVLDSTLTVGEPRRVHQLPGRALRADQQHVPDLRPRPERARRRAARARRARRGARPAGRRPDLPRGGRARRGGLGGRGLPVRDRAAARSSAT